MITRLPTALFFITWLGLVALPVAFLWIMLSGQITAEQAASAFPGLKVADDLSPSRVLAVFVFGLLPWFAVSAALWQAQALFALHRAGLALTDAAARRVAAIGMALAFAAVFRVLAHTAQVLLLTWGNPPGERVLAISLGFADFGFLVAAGLMIVIGRSMAEAARAVEDARGFV